MQQATYTSGHYTNTHIVNSHGVPGHGTGTKQEPYQDISEFSQPQNSSSEKTGSEEASSGKLRLTLAVMGNVLGGAVLLSGMLALPQLLVGLLAN